MTLNHFEIGSYKMIFDDLTVAEIFKLEEILGTTDKCFLGQGAYNLGAGDQNTIPPGFEFDDFEHAIDRCFICIKHVHRNGHKVS